MTTTAKSKFEADIARLEDEGRKLYIGMLSETSSKEDRIKHEKVFKDGVDFSSHYQRWYSEALSLILQVLPERVEDFKGFYAPKGARKDLTNSNYTISDYLRGISVTRGYETVVSKSAAVNPMQQQWKMIEGLSNRFSSTLYDIRTLVHADLLDDELQAAEELNRNGYQRGAGAVAGVVLEGHLAAVCQRHQIPLKKKDPAISDLNDALKSASVIDTAQWRFVQHLGDIRNKCDHKKTADPTKEEVAELIEGVRKITKTVL